MSNSQNLPASPLKDAWRSVSYLFRASPYQLAQEHRPVVSSDPSGHRDGGKSLPLSGPLFPQLSSEPLGRSPTGPQSVILWLSRSPAQPALQCSFLLEGLRRALWVQVSGISVGRRRCCTAHRSPGVGPGWEDQRQVQPNTEIEGSLASRSHAASTPPTRPLLPHLPHLHGLFEYTCPQEG